MLIATESTGRSVAWRKVVEEHLGKPFAEQVLAATLPREEPVLKVLHEVTVDGAALEKHIIHRGKRQENMDELRERHVGQVTG